MTVTDDERKKIHDLEKKIKLLERKLNQDTLSRILIEEANDRYQNIYKHILKQLTMQKEELEKARGILNEKTLELESANRQLLAAKENAEKSERFKSEFLTNMSHEIRTPMNAVIGYLSLLEHTDLVPLQREYAAEIKNASDILLFLVNDILDLSKIESGKMKFEERSFSLKKIIDESISLNRPKADEKGLYVLTDYDESIPAMLTGDAMRLKQVLNNLISNAVKFTAAGGITIKALYMGPCGEKEKISVSVTDTGIGIRDGEKEILFEPFIQSRSNIYEITGGTGLGLAICRQIVRQMGSDIILESEYGKGSKFSFELMLEKSSEPPQETLPVKNPDEEMNFRKDIAILAAEDNSISMQLFTKILNMLGLHADIAVNGNEAVARCMEKEYDLVFLDNIMPQKTGNEAAKEIRSSGKSRNAVIIAITAGVSKEEQEQLRSSGMNGFMAKPVNINEVKRIMNRFFPCGSLPG